MKRDEFLSTLGIGLAAVCTGCFAACGSKSESGTPQVNAPTNVNFSINLATQLLSVGESLTNSGVIVVRTGQGNTTGAFTAVQLACTHEGTSINYNSNQGKFICPNHGSQFSASGSVLLGPATSNLKTYNLSVSGSTLTVTG